VTILNKDSQYRDFHIHQTRFLVTEVNRTPQISADYAIRSVFLPARDGKAGEAKLIIPFTNPEIVGRFVFHCHVLKHEDKGMMMTVEVVQ
jgi:FtsP/CotA-like multicopper oxidase with cupredoxin domain